MKAINACAVIPQEETRYERTTRECCLANV
jgi:hypothetical protein